MKANEIGMRIRKLRESLNLSQKEFAQKMNLNQGTLSGIEKGVRGIKKGIGVDFIIKLNQTFKVDSNWLLTGEGKHKDLPVIAADARAEYTAETKYPAYPIINDVPAGYPETPLDDEIRAYFYIPDVPKNAFGLRVVGKSMEPDLFEGDIVVVNPNDLEIRKGEVGIFRHLGGTTIKICIPLPDDKGFILQPRNSRYEPILVTGDSDCTLIGKVIFKIVKYK